ncbi:TetR/AcrR family transcriptional regulator [Planomicrobium sp. CPCC 101079]|uniref:TetR/AcrR family transcriptional regulator n=1 Tax=Planomicrobium sp. CPCC 101079 TaxID=2599618 RepID=UPI0011B3EF33|nr:TetR family transcriptional regulator C-terminal domain-containing protein [Planomicrobium sp. CPCC 101079]TWT14328.1 TetR family transcriptional regulator [Planomicrobium sp. CPCC 101079]
MPKQIDHDTRKVLIAEATWRILLEQGVAGASVRNIAKEAGISLGSLRYFFHTQNELMNFSKELISERISQKVDNIFNGDQPPKEKIFLVLLELLPPTGEMENETRVRLIFKSNALSEKETIGRGEDGVFLAVKKVMSNLLLLNLLKKELDIANETERLYAVMEGLAFESLLRPNVLTATRIAEIIQYHLNAICKEEVK